MNNGLDYFFQTPTKEWDIGRAIKIYDDSETFSSLIMLLNKIEQDFIQLGSNQGRFKKSVNKCLNIIKDLKKIRCLNSTIIIQQQQQSSTTTPPANEVQTENSKEIDPATNIDRTAQKSTNHFESNIVNKKPTYNLTYSSGDDISEISSTSSTSLRSRISSSSSSSSSSASLVLGEGNSKYTFDSPSCPTDQPNKPKLRKIQLSALEQLFNFGTQYSINDSICENEYRNNIKQQQRLASLAGLGLLGQLRSLLGDEVEYEDFLHKLWNWKPYENMNNISLTFMNISKHVLSNFHLIHRSTSIHMLNHERTFFCENVVPGFLALSKMIKFVEFKWCEAEYKSTKEIYLKEGDYDGRATQAAKNIDGLGIMKTQNNMELVVVESSSGMLKEHTTHTMQDVIKILECNVAALRKEATYCRNSTLSTFKKLHTFGVHVIKTTVTLSKTSLHDQTKWKHVDVRTAKIPTTWDDRLLLLDYLELLATLYIDLLSTKEIQQTLVQERFDMSKCSSTLVESILE